MRKPAVGIILCDLQADQLNLDLFTHLHHHPKPATLFYELPAASLMDLPCPAMPLFETWSFPGLLICTRLSQVQKVKKTPFPGQLIFWVQDLEWLRMGRFPYDTLASVYRTPGMKIFARCPEHRGVIENAWNVSVAGVISHKEIGKFWEVDLAVN